MSEILYHKEKLFGPRLELHIAPEGLTLVGRGGRMSAEFAPITDVSSVTATKRKRKANLTISFDNTRPAWVVANLQPAVAEWAWSMINEEKSLLEKRAKPEYSKLLPVEEMRATCETIQATRDGRAAVDLADFILAQAILHGASDVHFDPFSSAVVVRFRLDGVLQDVLEIDASLKRQLTSRLKVISRLATFKNSVAQEGRAALKMGERTVDLRFSAIPTIHGEKVTVRIFDPTRQIFETDKLGLDESTLSEIEKILMQPQGTILLTGPAGSGKTTTMYASLSYLKENKKNLSSIATVEDPVEYDLQVVNQTQVNNTSGLTFANALRTVLRQDPEVIMIGEIRDKETADIAIQAGLTGHMVLSTVHARSAAGVMLRLVDLGVEPFLAASSVTAVLSQRLVRVVCRECARPYKPTAEERAKFALTGDEKLVMGAGCEKCAGTGYLGRTGIFHLVPVSDAMRDLVLRRCALDELEAQAQEEQARTLLHDGLAKAKAGITTIEEITRVLG